MNTEGLGCNWRMGEGEEDLNRECGEGKPLMGGVDQKGRCERRERRIEMAK